MFLKERRNRAEDEDVDEGEARKVDEFWSVGVVSVNFSFREKRPTLLTPPTRLRSFQKHRIKFLHFVFVVLLWLNY